MGIRSMALVLCLLAGAVGANASERVLLVGVFDHRPYMIVEGDAVSGTDVELARLVFEAAGYGVEFRVRPPARVFHEIETGELDALTGPAKTPEREKLLWFTSPIHAKVAQVFGPPGFRLESLDQLLRLEKPVGFIRGFTFGDNLNRIRDRLRERGLAEEEATTRANIQKLLAGRIAAFVDMRDPTLYEIRELGVEGKVVPVSDPVFMGWAHLALSRRTCTREDLERVEAALRQLRAQGRIPPLEFPAPTARSAR
ncbi:substrate-binding periplasmic protein [Deferrisoma palaeochoriense]